MDSVSFIWRKFGYDFPNFFIKINLNIQQSFAMLPCLKICEKYYYCIIYMIQSCNQFKYLFLSLCFFNMLEKHDVDHNQWSKCWNFNIEFSVDSICFNGRSLWHISQNYVQCFSNINSYFYMSLQFYFFLS